MTDPTPLSDDIVQLMHSQVKLINKHPEQTAHTFIHSFCVGFSSCVVKSCVYGGATIKCRVYYAQFDKTAKWIFVTLCKPHLVACKQLQQSMFSSDVIIRRLMMIGCAFTSPPSRLGINKECYTCGNNHATMHGHNRLGCPMIICDDCKCLSASLQVSKVLIFSQVSLLVDVKKRIMLMMVYPYV